MAMSLKHWHQALFTMTMSLKKMMKAKTHTIAGLIYLRITSTMLEHGNSWFRVLQEKKLRLTSLHSSLTLAATSVEE